MTRPIKAAHVLVPQFRKDPTSHTSTPLGKERRNLPVAYISKDILQRFCVYLEKAKNMQNQCFVLLIDFQTLGDIYREGKIPVWIGMEPAAIFF